MSDNVTQVKEKEANLIQTPPLSKEVVQKSKITTFESFEDLKFLREAMLGESQEDEVIDNLVDGFRKDFACSLSSSSDYISS